MSDLNGTNVILGVTGGIAAYKSAELARRLGESGASVRVVMTRAATTFITPLTLQAVSGHAVRVELLDSEAESGMDHIELARWADIVVIAPASADFIARAAAGMADDLLTTLCLATEAPLVLAPAMNRVMWSKAVTRRNLDSLIADGAHVVGPDEGSQACGETGAGRMSEPVDIVSAVHDLLTRTRDAAGIRVMITAGPTWEALDPVRGITNHSSGKMGYALASAFAAAGAEVTLVSGPCHLPCPAGVARVDVVSAQDMYDAVQESIAGQHIFIGVAAVADYRPKTAQPGKIKKDADTVTLELVRNPDILASVAARDTPPYCVGFAAETSNLEAYARGKLEAKRLDLVAANLVGAPSGGFNSEENTLLVIGRDSTTRIGPAPKGEVARILCGYILERYAQENRTEDSRFPASG